MSGEDSPGLISIVQLAELAELWDHFTHCGEPDSYEAEAAEKRYMALVSGYFVQRGEDLKPFTIREFEGCISAQCRRYLKKNS